jgi:hypothetical protein
VVVGSGRRVGEVRGTRAELDEVASGPDCGWRRSAMVRCPWRREATTSWVLPHLSAAADVLGGATRRGHGAWCDGPSR